MFEKIYNGKSHKINCKCFCCKSIRGETKGINSPNYRKSGENSPKWLGVKAVKRRKYPCKNKKCKNTIIWGTWKYGSGLCRSCSSKKQLKDPKNNPNYKDSKSLKKYYCIEKDCKNTISYNNFLYGSKKCRSCSVKGENNPMYGKFGKNAGNYIDGRYNKIYYCINNCKEIVSQKNNLCMSCAQKERFKNPQSHPNWLGGKSFEPYPLGWTKTFKEQIRYRDGYKCQLCGCSEVECKRKLSVHHIDYNKSNLDINNLIALCNSCHCKTNNKNREYWRDLFKNKFSEVNYVT